MHAHVSTHTLTRVYTHTHTSLSLITPSLCRFLVSQMPAIMMVVTIVILTSTLLTHFGIVQNTITVEIDIVMDTVTMSVIMHDAFMMVQTVWLLPVPALICTLPAHFSFSLPLICVSILHLLFSFSSIDFHSSRDHCHSLTDNNVCNRNCIALLSVQWDWETMCQEQIYVDTWYSMHLCAEM